jgi:hypothetical protein
MRYLTMSSLKIALLLLALVGGFATAEEGFDFGEGDFLAEIEIVEDDLVAVPEPPSVWETTAAPVALAVFFFFMIWLNKVTVPFKVSKEDLLLYHYPTGVKRGLAMALTMYGIAFAFGALEAWWQIHVHGSAEAYFANMSTGKLIAFTHAHLFGFTTSFLVIGVPFSMQFNHLRYYQIIFPIGLISALVDVMSWWGIKFIHPNFEYVSIFCGAMFSLSYLYMLVALLRVLLFPHVILFSDKDAEERRRHIQAAHMGERQE